MRVAVILFMLTNVFINHGNDESTITIGVFADCQYCDCETAGSRFYRQSEQKLEKCINHFNGNEQIDFVVNLGDLIDRDFTSFGILKPVLSRSKREIINIPGNHDFAVDPEKRPEVPRELGLRKTWHSTLHNGWMFIFTNGNDISFSSDNPDKVKEAVKISGKLKEEGKPNHYEWNGGMGKDQMIWLKKQLERAEKRKLKVAVFCHYPLLPYGVHCLWNHDEVLALINNYSCVKLWMNGHNHAGDYEYSDGIHYLTMKGMVETESENAFSEVTFSEDKIEIKGYGREESRSLEIY